MGRRATGDENPAPRGGTALALPSAEGHPPGRRALLEGDVDDPEMECPWIGLEEQSRSSGINRFFRDACEAARHRRPWADRFVLEVAGPARG